MIIDYQAINDVAMIYLSNYRIYFSHDKCLMGDF